MPFSEEVRSIPREHSHGRTAPAIQNAQGYVVMSEPQPTTDESSTYRYWAFVSHSSKDAKWARWLHRSIEDYGIPAHFVNHPTPAGVPAPKRFHPLFHYRTDLPASSNLREEIGTSLRESRFLIVICSPNAAKSKWVNEEIEEFQRSGRKDHVFAIIVDGEPNTGGPDECFPSALRQCEPGAPDVRPQADGRHNAKLRLLAGMLGVNFDALKQRDLEKQRFIWAMRGSLAFVAVAIVVVFWILWRDAQLEAETNLNIAKDRGRAEAGQRSRADTELAKQSMDHGLELCRVGEVSRGLLWLARSLESAPSDDAGLQYAIRSNISAWRDSITFARAALPHGESLDAVALSSDGRLAMTRTNSHGYLWDTWSIKPIKTFVLPEETPVGFDLRNRLIVARAARLSFWDAASGRFASDEIEHSALAKVEAIDRSGRFVLLGSRIDPVWVGELCDLTAIAEPRARLMLEDVQDMLLGSSGTIALSAGPQGADAWLFLPRATKLFGPLRHGARIVAMAFTPDERYILTGGGNGVRVWETESGDESLIEAPGGFEVLSVDVDSGGSSVLIGSKTSEIIPPNAPFYEVTRTKGKAQVLPFLDSAEAQGKELSYADHFRQVHFSPDGTTFLALHRHEVRVWDPFTGKPVGPPAAHSRKPQFQFEPSITAMAYSEDGTTLITSGEDHNAITWNVAMGRRQGRVLGRAGLYIAAVFSADGKSMVIASENLATLLDSRHGRPIAEPFLHPSIVRSMSFNPTGEILVTGTGADHSNGETYFWDISKREMVGPPLRHSNGVVSVAVSPDGRAVAISTADGMTQLWDIDTRDAIGQPMRLGELIHSIEFSADGSRLLTVGRSGETKLWDAASGASVGANYQRPLAFSPNFRHVALASQNVVTLRQVETGAQVGVPMHHTGRVYAVAFSPDGRTILTGSGDRGLDVEKGMATGRAQFWDADTGKPLRQPLIHQDLVTAVSFGLEGRSILTASWDGTVQRWESSTCRRLGPPYKLDFLVQPDHDQVQFSADGKTILAWQAGGRPVLWSIPEPVECNADDAARAVETWTGMRLDTAGNDIRLDDETWRQLRDLALCNPGEPSTLSEWASEESTTSNHNARTPEAGEFIMSRPTEREPSIAVATPSQLLQHTGPVTCSVFSQDSILLAVGSGEWGDDGFGELKVWDCFDGKMRFSAKLKLCVSQIAFAPNGQLVATFSGAGTVTVWDVVNGEVISTFSGEEAMGVQTISFLPDSRSLVTSIYHNSLDSHSSIYSVSDPAAIIWDCRDGTRIATIHHQQDVPSFVTGQDCLMVAVSPEGTHLASGDYLGNVKLWQIPGGQEMATISCSSSIRSLAFSADGKTVAAGLTGDECVSLIDVSTGKLRMVLRGSEMQVHSLQFAVQGTAVAAVDTGMRFSFARSPTFVMESRTSKSSRIQMWNSGTGQLLGDFVGQGFLKAPISSDGRFIAFRRDAEQVILWSAEKRGDQCRLPNQPGIEQVVVSPDGRWVASRDSTDSIHVWNTQDGSLQMAPGQAWRAMLFSPDSRWLVTSREDGAAGLWEIAGADDVAPPKQR